MSGEADSKSAVVGVLLNFVWPGSHYLYLGNWGLGLVMMLVVYPVTLLSAIFLTFGLMGIGGFFVWSLFVVDGALAPGRYNRRLMARLERSEGALDHQSAAMSAPRVDESPINSSISISWDDAPMALRQKASDVGAIRTSGGDASCNPFRPVNFDGRSYWCVETASGVEFTNRQP